MTFDPKRWGRPTPTSIRDIIERQKKEKIMASFTLLNHKKKDGSKTIFEMPALRAGMDKISWKWTAGGKVEPKPLGGPITLAEFLNCPKGKLIQILGLLTDSQQADLMKAIETTYQAGEYKDKTNYKKWLDALAASSDEEKQPLGGKPEDKAPTEKPAVILKTDPAPAENKPFMETMTDLIKGNISAEEATKELASKPETAKPAAPSKPANGKAPTQADIDKRWARVNHAAALDHLDILTDICRHRAANCEQNIADYRKLQEALAQAAAIYQGIQARK